MTAWLTWLIGKMTGHQHTGADGSSQLVGGSIPSGLITNAMIVAAAGIPYSKLSLASSIVSGDIVDGTIVDGDISASAGVLPSKFALAAFLSVLASTQNNVTGDGTAYVVQNFTNIFDLATAMNGTTGIFTAPATGRYLVLAMITITGIGAGHTGAYVEFVATSRTYRVGYVNPAAVANSGIYSWTIAAPLDMTLNDTVKVQVTVSGSTKTVNVYGAATLSGTTFGGLRIN